MTGAAWVWRMAWRDTRRSRQRLLLYSTAIVMGIAALVAVGSFGRALRGAMDQQARSLLGADLVISSRQPIAGTAESFARSLGGEQAREIAFTSMIQFPKSGGTRLVQVRALAGGFPFYGAIETVPVAAAADFHAGRGALVEESLLTQFEAVVGDRVQIGELTVPIIGILQRVPGETFAFATFAPRVFVPLAEIERTGLLQPGSLARYKTYYRFEPDTDADRLVEQHRPQLRQFRLRAETVATRKENLGDALDNAYHFLNLVGFVSLLLGGIGIASAIHVHIKQRLGTVAILRCLGSSVRQTFAIYLIQGTALGLIGAVCGAAVGVSVQRVIPLLMRELLPFPVTAGVSWPAVGQAMGVGFAICCLFTLLPLLAVRRVTPLAALRQPGAGANASWKDPAAWVVYGLIALGGLGFCVSQTQRAAQGLGLGLGLGAAFGVLAITAKLITLAARRLVSARWPYVMRQGVANLYRPNNRTVLLLLSLGLGTFLILTLFFVHDALLRQLSTSRHQDRSNAILFDIQTDQREAVTALVRSLNLAVLQEAPLVTMRLLSIKGRPIAEILADPRRTEPGWALQREYRSTYRDELADTERLLAGQWPPSAVRPGAPVPVSIEEGIASDLGVTLGDSVVFDVQGLPIHTTIASIRKVEWRRIQPNFFVVFPTGVLEQAPTTFVLATRVDSATQSATLQREVVRQFPTVSAIDLTLIIQTVDKVVSRIGAVIRFMTLFTVVTGLAVLAAAISTGRYQRLRECMLLRTLGASRRQILQILATEYLCLGVLAGLTGLVLALAASWALAAVVFKIAFVPALAPMVGALLVTGGATLLAGLLASRGIGNHPPLEILRAAE